VWYDADNVFFRRRTTPRPISEAVAYARCYGDRSTEIVSVRVAPPAPPPAPRPKVSGEKLRQDFEARLSSRV
jgi:hypothetical protein